jgi:hypothetical protein
VPGSGLQSSITGSVMMDKIWNVIVPNLIGFCLMIGGWYLSIVDVGVRTRIKTYQEIEYVTVLTIIGLIMILVGAYLPRVWRKIRGN